MNIKNVSAPMAERFRILDELVKGGYINKIKPIHPLLPSLCYFPQQTSKFNDAPLELKKKFRRMFSFYAFFLSPFAFAQTKIAKDYFIIISIYMILVSLLPPQLSPLVNKALSYTFSYIISQMFTFSRYYQYQMFGECSSNRNIFSTICLGFILLFAASFPGVIISILLYGPQV